MSATFTLDALLNNSTLQRSLSDLHREGQYLVATCPNCQHSNRSFFTGPKVKFKEWHCRHCDHQVKTARLLGGSVWTQTARPAIKAWAAPECPTPSTVTAIRSLYRSLALFAQSKLSSHEQAIEALSQRGLDWRCNHQTMAFIQNAGIGFINWPLYLDWWAGLSATEQAMSVHAGLPAGDNERASGFGAMFASGFKGKLVIPYYDQAGDVVDLRTRSVSHKDTVAGKQIRYTSPKLSPTARGVDVPYGVSRLGHAPRIVLTEGEFKALVPMAYGSIPILGLRGVNDFMPEYLDYCRNRLVVLAFDNDDKCQPNGLTAGQAATVLLGRKLQANDIAIMVLDPAKLGDCKGLDDYVLKHGGVALSALLHPANLYTLHEFEAKFDAEQLAKFVNPKTDPGTVRQWTPGEHVDIFAHAEQPVVTVDTAVEQIRNTVNRHLTHYKRGNDQLLITAPAGVGKTLTTIDEALQIAQANDLSVAVVLPNHATIAEKIAEGTLAGFRHVYGHNEENCQQADKALALTKHGFSPGQILCPDCPMIKWCKTEGYKSQFIGKENRAYPHAHIFTSYPEGEDIVIIDELTHKNFVGSVELKANDITSALAKAVLAPAQRSLLEAVLKLYTSPALGPLTGAPFYEVLERYYPDLRNVDAWGDGGLVQLALDSAAGVLIADNEQDLPQQFGEKLFSVLAEDVRRLNNGEQPTHRIRLNDGRLRRLEITFSRGRLPAWYTKRPTVILNATADAGLMQDLLGPVKVLAPNVALARGNQIIQNVTRNNAKSAYTGNREDATARRAAWLNRIRHQIAQHPGGEVDTVIITTKALAAAVIEAFPAARVAYYHALEGRNDLQAGLTILASPPPINLDAIRREAAALYLGIDLTLTRTLVAFDEANAGGEYLAIEQVDGADPRLQRLIWQHRDAAAIQAIHRARLVRQSGRTVVVMFSRPIPGVRPTSIIRDYPDAATREAERTQDALDRLLAAGRDLIDDVGGFTVETLAMVSDCSVNTVRKYWVDVVKELSCQWFNAPVAQPLNNGAAKIIQMRIALPRTTMEKCKMHEDHGHYKYDLITLVIFVHPLLPHGWEVNLSLMNSPENAPTTHPETSESAPPSPLPGRWAMLRNPQGFKRSLQMAKGSEDPAQRSAYSTAINYFNGKNDDQPALNRALWAMGESHAINWQ